MPDLTASVHRDDTRLSRPSGIRSLHLGETKVTYLPDGFARLRPLALLPDSTEATWAAHPEYLDETGNLAASVGALLVEHGGRALLIDAGIGPHSFTIPDGPLHSGHGGALPDSLAAVGRRPEDIEAVAFTHLHSDHLGWACEPLLGHAGFLVSEPEWAGRDTLEDHVVAALSKNVRTIAHDEEVFPGVRVRIAPGHTVGHTEYVITGGGRRLIAFGDAMHSPIQAAHPSWSSGFDHDPAATAPHRHRLLAELSEPGTTGFGVHFADVVFGRVDRTPDGPSWHPVDA
ncbi:MBL fold metallo-hydrolase [Streptomyces polychromogenes]|uniref:MBL fold metallo-hydrolase n=1 Tax=Streptomyces polychromogenes TaxID=67342 RepID=A0ABN0V069_9ACTN